jgi:hypothetical protein
MNPTLKGLDQWPNRAALPSSSPVEAFSSPERVETAALNPEWIIADFNMDGTSTEWTTFIRTYRHPDGGICLYSKQAMADAFRAGYEAGRKA